MESQTEKNFLIIFSFSYAKLFSSQFNELEWRKNKKAKEFHCAIEERAKVREIRKARGRIEKREKIPLFIKYHPNAIFFSFRKYHKNMLTIFFSLFHFLGTHNSYEHNTLDYFFSIFHPNMYKRKNKPRVCAVYRFFSI